jgi:hydroxyacylglutathione hydrolase
MLLPDETKIYCAHEYTLNNLRFAQLVEPSNRKINERIKYVISLLEKNQPSLPSTLREEKQTNPFLRCDSLEIMKHVSNHIGYALDNPIKVFSELRKWKNNF